LRSAERIWIAVGFVKRSGVKLLGPLLERCVDRGATVTAFVGLSFCLSEPDAIGELRRICQKRDGNRLYLCDPPGDMVFHPKVYCCEQGGSAAILVGSANATGGGMEGNIESSLAVTVVSDSELLRSVKAFFRSLKSEPWTKRGNEIRIARYKRRYDIVRRSHRKAEKEAQKELSGVPSFDIEAMRSAVRKYRADAGVQENWRQKVANYRKARKILLRMSRTVFAKPSDFLRDYERLVGTAGKRSLWHSDGLYRSKKKVARNHGRFVKMLAKLIENLDHSPERVFEMAVNCRRKMPGLGVNVITETLNTLAPDRFSVLNRSPVGVLKLFGFPSFPTPNSFKAEAYREFNALIAEIAAEFGFKDLSRVDHFLNYVYWREHKKIKRKKKAG